MSKEELLAIWRRNLNKIELDIANCGGETKAPIDLINLRDNTKREIAGITSSQDESGTGWLAQASIIAWFRADYARDMAALRGELASWQAITMKDVDDMVDQRVGPTERAVDSLSTKLDSLVASMQTMSVQVAIMARDVETVKAKLTELTQAQKEIERIKGHVGMNGDARSPSSHMSYVVILLTAFVIVAGGAILWSTLR